MASPTERANLKLYQRLWRYLSGYWRWFSIAVVAMVVASVTTPFFALLTKPLIDKGFIEQNKSYMVSIPIAIVLLFLLRGFANFLNDYLTTYLSSHLVQRVRAELYRKIVRLPLSFFHQESSGRMVSRVLSDADQITDAGFNVVTVLAKDGVVVVGLLLVLFYLDWRLTLITFFTLVIVSILVRLLSKRMRHLTTLNQSYLGKMASLLKETIEGIKEIKVYGAYKETYQTFQKVTHDIRRNQVKQRVANAASTAITQFLIACALAAIIFFAGLRSHRGLTAGTFMAFLSSMMAMFDPLKRMTNVMQILQRGLSGAESVFRFLDRSEEKNRGQLVLSDLKENIYFDKVFFQYPEGEKNALKGVDLRVKKGEVVAIVGASGSGKSTLVNLLPRFYEPTAGKVYWDGTPLNAFALESLRESIAIVNQDIVLFDDTIAYNVAFGTSVSRPEIVHALKAANAWEFVTALPKGIDSKIGENGARLSGGQRQRLMIARAFLKKAPILILDEATSALDMASEKAVQEALERLMQECTTLVIAHRLATVRSADFIVVMNEGEIVEQGSHEQLLAQAGFYRRLYQMQFEKNRVDKD